MAIEINKKTEEKKESIISGTLDDLKRSVDLKSLGQQTLETAKDGIKGLGETITSVWKAITTNPKENGGFFGGFIGLFKKFYDNISILNDKEEDLNSKDELDNLRSQIPEQKSVDYELILRSKIKTPDDWKIYSELGEEKGWKTAFYSWEIHNNYILKIGQSYNSTTEVENLTGTSRMLKNNCVGFVLESLENLPFKSGEKYLSAYSWAGKDGLRDYIPDAVNGDKSKYTNIDDAKPETIDSVIGKNLGIGEHAIAAVFNHIFIIYKDKKGEIRMVQSGANLDEKTYKIKGESEVSDIPLKTYLTFMKNSEGKVYERYKEKNNNKIELAFASVSSLVANADETENNDLNLYAMLESEKQNV